jgi:integrase
VHSQNKRLTTSQASRSCLSATVGDTFGTVQTSFEPTDKQNLYIRQPLGVFYARLYQGGKTKWVSLGTRNKSVAKIELAKRLQDHYAVRDATAATRKGTATVADLASLYLQGVDLDTSLKPASKEYRHKTVKYLLRSWPELGGKLPARVTEGECKEWAARYHRDFSETLYNNTVSSLRHLFDIAIGRGLIARNPALEIAKVRVPQKKLELPSSDQFKAIVEHIREAGSATSQGCGDLVEFLAYSGCRINEAARVRWIDADEAKRRIYIAPGKNGESRYIPLLEPMRDLLKRIKEAPRWFRSNQRKDGGFILSVAECEEALTNACTKADAHRITHHDLRHLFATRCIEAGVDIPTVSRWLGHKDGGALAMRTYGHLRSEHFDAMAAKVAF